MTTHASNRPLEAFIASENVGSSTPFLFARQALPFVTLSREAGSGGSSLAMKLARRLNALGSPGPAWRVFEENIVTHTLAELGLPNWMARFLGEKRTPELRAWLGETIGLHPNIHDLVQKIHAMQRTLAEAGNVILVGRGANRSTAALAGGVHVRLVAPPEHRAAFLARHYDVTEAQALQYNKRCDAERRSYLTSHWGSDDSKSSAFDLLINTGKVSLDDACDLVAAQVGRRQAALAAPARA